jgi:integrase
MTTIDSSFMTARARRRAWSFRDTFAVSLLLKGVSIEIVSKLLGHSSIKVTERHYSPRMKARHDQLETEVRRIWATESAAT